MIKSLSNSKKETKKILYYNNVDWSFISHRIELARLAVENGYEVHLLTNITNQRKTLESLNIVVHESYLSRRYNVFKDIIGIINFIRILIIVRPDIVHAISNKNILIVSLFGRLIGIKKIVLAISGFGHLFIKKNVFNLIFKYIFKNILSLSLRNNNSTIIVQNSDDKKYIKFISSNKSEDTNIVLIPGSGVDIRYFKPQVNSSKIIEVSLVARMIYEKGVREFVEAARILKKRYKHIKFILYGNTDEGNPSSIPKKILNQWNIEGAIEWRGFEIDKLSIYRNSQIIVLPSYREGMPKTILEAAACGLPAIVTNVPGCRESIIPNKTGFLVELFDIDDLVSKIEELILDQEKRNLMGSKARLLAEEKFDINKINSEQMKLYN